MEVGPTIRVVRFRQIPTCRRSANGTPGNRYTSLGLLLFIQFFNAFSSRIFVSGAEILTAVHVRTMVYLHPDGSTVNVDHIVGNGSNGLVLSHGCYVLKIPKTHDTSGFTGGHLAFEKMCNEENNELLKAEKEAYARLKDIDGIAECINCSPAGIILRNYTHGSLENFIAQDQKHREKINELKTALIEKAIGIVRRCHQKSVLLNDIALRNFMMTDDDLSIVMIDFGQCRLFDQASGMTLSSGDGSGAEVDIFQLGCVLFSLSTWEKYELEVPDTEPPWHHDSRLLDTIYGDIVAKCWGGLYASMDEVHSDFEASRQQLSEETHSPHRGV